MINTVPINAGMIKFITHKLKVAASILISLASKTPHIWRATSPLANKSQSGGNGMLVCTKKIVEIPANAAKIGILNPKNNKSR